MTKTYIFPDGKKAVFGYDHNGVGKITLECMDMLMSLLGTTAEQTEPNCSEKPNNCEPKVCDTCRYYNSNIPCGSTPSACKEADKFAEEFVYGLKKLKPKDEPQTERLEQFRVGLEYHTDTTHFGKTKGESVTMDTADTPQTDCAWK